MARGSAAVKPVAALLKDPNPYVQARAVGFWPGTRDLDSTVSRHC